MLPLRPAAGRGEMSHFYVQNSMKKLLLAALLLAGTAAQAQTSAEVQALTRRLNELAHDPSEPATEIKATLSNCHFTEVIRKYRTAGSGESGNFQVSHQKNGSDWAVKSDDKVEFELRLGVEWSQVTSLTYAAAHDDKKNSHYYEIKIKRQAPGTDNSTTLEMPVYTADEAVVRDLVQRMEKVRRSCGAKG
jgi:opacity protein-like surface antigen